VEDHRTLAEKHLLKRISTASGQYQAECECGTISEPQRTKGEAHHAQRVHYDDVVRRTS